MHFTRIILILLVVCKSVPEITTCDAVSSSTNKIFRIIFCYCVEPLFLTDVTDLMVHWGSLCFSNSSTKFLNYFVTFILYAGEERRQDRRVPKETARQPSRHGLTAMTRGGPSKSPTLLTFVSGVDKRADPPLTRPVQVYSDAKGKER